MINLIVSVNNARQYYFHSQKRVSFTSRHPAKWYLVQLLLTKNHLFYYYGIICVCFYGLIPVRVDIAFNQVGVTY